MVAGEFYCASFTPTMTYFYLVAEYVLYPLPLALTQAEQESRWHAGCRSEKQSGVCTFLFHHFQSYAKRTVVRADFGRMDGSYGL